MLRRVEVAKKEELLGEDTNRIDQAEYKLQSMVSPETYEAGRFFYKPPSKEIGSLRVDTMSPAQVSFIQSSTQWHKYFKPSSPASLPSNIFPDDPVPFPGMKPKESANDAQGFIGGGLEGLGNEDLPKHHQTNYNNWNSYGSYGDTGPETYQHQKDYEEPPFTDKSWMNPKSDSRPPGGSYESFDGKSVAVPETKQEELPGPLNHFDSQSQDQEILGGNAGLGNVRHHSRLLEDQRTNLLDKINGFKEDAVMPQGGDDKVFFGGENRKLLSGSDVARSPLLGPSAGLGTALAEELLQKNRDKSQRLEDSTEMVEGLREGNTALRSGTNGLFDSRLLARPMFDERATQRTLMHDRLNNFDNDRGHLVLIRSHQLNDNSKNTSVKEHAAKNTNKEKHKDRTNKAIRRKINKTSGHDSEIHKKLKISKSKMIVREKSTTSLRKRL